MIRADQALSMPCDPGNPEGLMTTRQHGTRRQLEVLRAYVTAGSIAAAAYGLGISETTVRQHLSGLYRRTGCLNAAQAAYLLGRHDDVPAIGVGSGAAAGWRTRALPGSANVPLVPLSDHAAM